MVKLVSPILLAALLGAIFGLKVGWEGEAEVTNYFSNGFTWCDMFGWWLYPRLFDTRCFGGSVAVFPRRTLSGKPSGCLAGPYPEFVGSDLLQLFQLA